MQDKQLSEQNNKGQKKKQKEEKVQPIKMATTQDSNITNMQREKLVSIAKKRLESLKTTETLDTNELEILSKIIEKKEDLTEWNRLIEVTKNEKAYGIMNIATFDYLYSIIAKKDKENEVIDTIYLLDCINGGVGMKKGELDCFPKNLDINATIINLLNNTLNNKEKSQKFNAQTIRRACLDLAANGGYKNVNWAAKQVAARVILDNLADVVYDYKNENILSDENKIYLRILAVLISGKDYKDIIEKFSNSDV